MIRLAVFGADGQVCNEIDRRLHGSISLLSADAISVGTPLAAVDASVFVGSRTPDPDEMLQIVSDGKPVLLANDTVFAMEGLDATLDRESSESRIAVMNPDRWLPSRRLISDELKGTKLGPVGLIRSHRWEASGSHVLERCWFCRVELLVRQVRAYILCIVMQGNIRQHARHASAIKYTVAA